jgi:hypothetical protein
MGLRVGLGGVGFVFLLFFEDFLLFLEVLLDVFVLLLFLDTHHHPCLMLRALILSTEAESSGSNALSSWLKIVFFKPTTRFLGLPRSLLNVVAQVGAEDAGRRVGRGGHPKRARSTSGGGTASRNDDLRGNKLLGSSSRGGGGGVAETHEASKKRRMMPVVRIISMTVECQDAKQT